MRYLFTTALVATGLAGSAMAQENIDFWYETANPDQQGWIQELLIDGFEAANPGFGLTIDYRGNELDKQLRIAMLSGSGPDVVLTPGPSYVAPMAQNGQLLSLEPYAEQYGWNAGILPVFLEMGRYDGTLYALPKTYETIGLYYNKTLFAENGWEVPETLAELEALADVMLDAGIQPFSAGNSTWRGANEWFVTIALNSVAGPDNVHAALIGQIPWTSEPFVEAINTLKGWWEKGYFSENYFSIDGGEQAMDLLATGQAGMMPSGTWQFQNVPTYFDQAGTEPGFVGFPSADGAPVFALGVGSTFSIAASSDVPDGAAAVIGHIFTPEFYSAMGSQWQGEWNMPLSDLSGVAMAETVLPLYTEAMANLAASVGEGSYGYTTWTFLPPATNNYLINGIEEVWLDQITAEQYLAEIEANFQSEMAEGKVPAIPSR